MGGRSDPAALMGTSGERTDLETRLGEVDHRPRTVEESDPQTDHRETSMCLGHHGSLQLGDAGDLQYAGLGERLLLAAHGDGAERRPAAARVESLRRPPDR